MDVEETSELLAILQAPLIPGTALAIQAVAGAGKSTSLQALVHAHPSKQFLYLSFNTSVAVDIEARFASSAIGIR